MSKDAAKKVLGIFKWLKIVGAVLLFIAAVIFFTNSANNMMNELVQNINVEIPSNVNVSTVFGIAFIFLGLIRLIEAWLFGRTKEDGSKSTLLLVLLVLGTV